MLALAKATGTELELVKDKAGKPQVPWLKASAKNLLPLKTLGVDANHALTLLCKEFNVWEEQGLDLGKAQVYQDDYARHQAVLASFGAEFALSELIHRPFLGDSAIMKLRLEIGNAVAGEVQWFPGSKPAEPRYAEAANTMQEPAGMWQCASGEFIMLFEMMPLNGANTEFKLNKFDLTTHCIVLDGATKDGHFTPNGTFRTLRPQWENGFLYIGHYQVSQVLFAVQSGVPRTQRIIKKRQHFIPDCGLTKPSQQTTRVLFASSRGGPRTQRIITETPAVCSLTKPSQQTTRNSGSTPWP